MNCNIPNNMSGAKWLFWRVAHELCEEKCTWIQLKRGTALFTGEIIACTKTSNLWSLSLFLCDCAESLETRGVQDNFITKCTYKNYYMGILQDEKKMKLRFANLIHMGRPVALKVRLLFTTLGSLITFIHLAQIHRKYIYTHRAVYSYLIRSYYDPQMRQIYT